MEHPRESSPLSELQLMRDKLTRTSGEELLLSITPPLKFLTNDQAWARSEIMNRLDKYEKLKKIIGEMSERGGK